LAGILGGCAGIEPIVEAGDSVIKISENVNESVGFGQAEAISESITESVTVIVT